MNQVSEIKVKEVNHPDSNELRGQIVSTIKVWLQMLMYNQTNYSD